MGQRGQIDGGGAFSCDHVNGGRGERRRGHVTSDHGDRQRQHRRIDDFHIIVLVAFAIHRGEGDGRWTGIIL